MGPWLFLLLQPALAQFYQAGAWGGSKDPRSAASQREAKERAYPQRLVGIDDARLPLYSSVAGGSWLLCGTNNSTKVPPNRVNDNYCDCTLDGLDEPSTSACSGVGYKQQGVAVSAYPGVAAAAAAAAAPNASPVLFWCANAGVNSVFIPTSRVSDGVCDCCDGADEYFNNNAGPSSSSPSFSGEVCDPNGCEVHRAQALANLASVRRGLEKRAALELALVGELEGQRARVSQLRRDCASMEAFSLRLKYHEQKELASERKVRRLEVFDKWSDGTARRVCVGDPAPLRDDTVEGYRGLLLSPEEQALEEGMSGEQKASRRHEAARKRLHELKRGLECVAAKRPPRVMERLFGWDDRHDSSSPRSSPRSSPSTDPRVASASEAVSRKRVEAVRLVEGPAAGLSVGTWLEREKGRLGKKLSQRYATRQQYRDETTLLSWILNHRDGPHRAATLGLLAAGAVLSPLTLTLSPLLHRVANAVLGENVDTTTNTTAQQDQQQGSYSDADDGAAAAADDDDDYDGTPFSSFSFFSPSSWSLDDFLFGADFWRRRKWSRNLVYWFLGWFRSSEWARAVVLEAPYTLKAMASPETSIAFSRNLLTYTHTVALLQGGLRACELELDVLNGIVSRMQQDLDFQDSHPANGFSHLWFSFRTRCFEIVPKITHGSSFKFCPFKENFEDGRSLGKWRGWGSEGVGASSSSSAAPVMQFAGGGYKGGNCHHARTSEVRFVCSDAYALQEVLPGCHTVLTFGTPIACTPRMLNDAGVLEYEVAS